MSLMKKYYPWSAGLPKAVSVNLATLFGLGKLKAPGTWGSAAGVVLYMALFASLDLFRYAVFAVLLAYIAVGICDAAERAFAQKDSPQIILDEFVAIPFCLIPFAGIPFTFWQAVLAFALFRFFDIKKPWIINRMQLIEGGAGVVADDIVAAGFVCVIMNAGVLAFSAF